MKVLLIGANGQLGTDIRRLWSEAGDHIVPAVRPQFDVTDAAVVESTIAGVRPDLVINTAAYHRVEECEIQSAKAFQVNATAVRDLAAICARNEAAFVHFSTDYVFGGERSAPWLETDRPNPLNVYGVSKLAGEYMAMNAAERVFVVRTCGLFGHAGSSGKGGNFVETMLRKAAAGEAIRVVNDQVLTPTATADLARVLRQLVQTNAFGLYHLTCEGQCSWYEFTQGILELAGLKADLSPVSSAAFASPVKRPGYSVLSKQKLGTLGLSMPHWRDALAGYLAHRLATSAK